MGKDYKLMTNEEKIAEFDKIQGKREDRKVGSKARRTALTQLIEAHKVEYNKLLTSAGGKPKAAK